MDIAFLAALLELGVQLIDLKNAAATREVRGISSEQSVPAALTHAFVEFPVERERAQRRNPDAALLSRHSPTG